MGLAGSMASSQVMSGTGKLVDKCGPITMLDLFARSCVCMESNVATAGSYQ